MKRKIDLPPQERQENKVRAGVLKLTDTELLAVILGSGIAGRNVKVISSALLKKFGAQLVDATVDDLTTIKGIGRVKAAKLVACFELFRRLAKDPFGTQVQEPSMQMVMPELAVEYPIYRFPREETCEKSTLWSVDLFAGCGGLSLGLEQAGFKSLLVSELNRNAMETFLANRTEQEVNITSIHDVYSLTNEVMDDLMNQWKKHGIEEIDIVAGGPPCQGYSGIGHRRSYKVEKEEIPSNFLFKEMARVVARLKPKIFLFENVKGLLSARWTANGRKGEIWEAVQKEFRELNHSGYFIRFELVQAKNYGVPQNRPRVLMVGIRKNLGFKPIDFAAASGLLPEPCGTPPNIEDVLSDLEDPDFLKKKLTSTYFCEPKTPIQRKLRMSKDGKALAHTGAHLSEQEYSNHAPQIREKFQFMIDHNGSIPAHMRTKKFAQRVLPRKWDKKGPTITVTSVPEDYVHYSQPRALTVREWARLQMFPDWYQFMGPRTTGGQRRAGNPHKGIWDREVPRYTQIGNAVPVELARRVGCHLANILKSLQK